MVEEEEKYEEEDVEEEEECKEIVEERGESKGRVKCQKMINVGVAINSPVP